MRWVKPNLDPLPAWYVGAIHWGRRSSFSGKRQCLTLFLSPLIWCSPDFEMSGTNNIPSCLLISWDKVHRLGDSSHRHLLSHSSGGQRSEIRRGQAGSLWGLWGKDPVHVSSPAAGSLRHSLPWRRLSLGVFPLSSLYTCLHVSKLPLFTKTQTLWVRTHPKDCIFIWLLLQRPHFQRR